ncbi:MAG: CBS domain-containing protein [Clostridia bacterium]|nr:CBS domain-containing protein [Clostridia bacterium]
MNIAFFLKPKASVAYLYSDFTVRQALEKMRHYGYAAIPVISRDGKYVGSVSEGDFLWFFLDRFRNNENVDRKYIDEMPLKKLIHQNTYNPVKITSGVEEILNVSMNQNFVPVVDDLGSFIGIITRSDVMKYLTDSKKQN